MAMSDDILAVTFTPEHSPNVSIDGMLMDSQTTAAVLREAKRRPKVKELTLRSVTIDDVVAKAAKDLFSDSERVWGKIELIHCTGHTAQVIAFGIGHTQQFSFTGSVPIAHNRRYSLDEPSMRVLGNALKDCKSLNSLTLKGSRLVERGLQTFGEGLSRSETLQTLQLSHCAVEVPGVAYLTSALKQNHHLRVLSMMHCKIGSTQFSDESSAQFCQILESLVSHPSLQKFNLYGMYCTQQAMQTLSDMLRAPRSKLWHLGMKNNVHHPEDKLDVRSLFQSLETNTALTYMQVSGNNLNDTDMEQLAQILKRSNRTLRVVSLTANNIGDEGILSFADQLPDMKGLRYLDIQRNPFTRRSKTEIVAALKHNVELERLDLDGTYDDTKAFYLRLNKGGRRLLLSGNNTPLGLWPIVLERASRLPFNRSAPHAHLDIFYTLLRGPALFQPRLKRIQSHGDEQKEFAETTHRSRKRRRIS